MRGKRVERCIEGVLWIVVLFSAVYLVACYSPFAPDLALATWSAEHPRAVLWGAIIPMILSLAYAGGEMIERRWPSR